MGIPSLNSAILYIVSLYFHCHRFLHSLRSVEMTRVHPIRMTGYHLEQSSHCYLGDRSPLSFLSLLLKRQADYERASYCHFERAKRVEKSKSLKSDLVHENRHFHGRQAHFSVPIQENSPFHGQQSHFSVPIQENSPFHGRQAHFSVLVHENSHFSGRGITIQSCLIKEEASKLRQGCQINSNLRV